MFELRNGFFGSRNAVIIEMSSIVIKLSGEGLSGGGEKYAKETLEAIANQISELLKNGTQIALVVGGGNLFRGGDLAGDIGIERPTADYIGMLATVQNALVLRDYFESRGIITRVLSAISMPQVCEGYIPKRAERHMAKGRVVIFAAGLGAPFFTTDTTTVQRALEIKADMLVMVKNKVDGIYSADPKVDPNAEKILEITGSEVLNRNLKIADAAAIALAKQHGLTIKIISIKDIAGALLPDVGSVIKPS